MDLGLLSFVSLETAGNFDDDDDVVAEIFVWKNAIDDDDDDDVDDDDDGCFSPLRIVNILRMEVGLLFVNASVVVIVVIVIIIVIDIMVVDNNIHTVFLFIIPFSEVHDDCLLSIEGFIVVEWYIMKDLEEKIFQDSFKKE